MLRTLSIGTTLALAWVGAALTGAAACGDAVDGVASTTTGGQGGTGASSGQGGLGQGGQGLGPVPDFSLLDVNETSPTHDTRVSPRDYLDQVSAWYFAEAT